MRLLTALLRPAVALAAALVLLGGSPLAAHAAPGPGVGWIRVGHFSPKVPPVDIYFAAFGKPEKVVIRKAGYGAVTPYSSVAPGAYTVSMRPADAAASSPPALSATIELKEASAYSLLVFANGPGGGLQGSLVQDDLSAPAAGNGRVRVVQGSAALTPVSVAGQDGKSVVNGAAYGSTTPYTELPEGRWPLKLTSGGTTSESTVDVKAGSTTSLLVTENGTGLKTEAIADGATLPDPPKLGVETGGGGTAPESVPWWLFVLPVALALLVFRRRPAHDR
ncbi:DUF4397 domain-containing protein [Amycolatopsis azurea]|uniref:Peptidase n=1 Tax=Amycolatopsis azurea DSM 43854 TaxID=1238180 RepID=M2QTQ9_9PSEU|nr:DUF4397 domain-containing protein [Amycolatopsis azurea]EMD29891.1 hypothetical protein C791_1554 [Amycolatopsis azurea DSM 43854]OOC04860.1 peptidase [Amycolatopsis azurea DSM 43854]